MFSRGPGAVIAALVVTGILGGCANLGRSDKEIVAERAQQRWDLLVKGDFTGAYGFMSPAGREVMRPDASGLAEEAASGPVPEGGPR